MQIFIQFIKCIILPEYFRLFSWTVQSAAVSFHFPQGENADKKSGVTAVTPLPEKFPRRAAAQRSQKVSRI
jgi:hypothetical protein